MEEEKEPLNSLPEMQVVELDFVPVSGAGFGGGEELPAYNILENNQGASSSTMMSPPPPPPPFEKSQLSGSGDEKGDGEKYGLLGEAPASTAQHQQAKTGEAWFAARIPSTTPPSFVSFAVTRAYRVKAKVGLEVAGKKVEMDVEGVVDALGSGI